ncbi:MAG: NAD(+) diphosphatase [Bacteroidaceae bacterium]|nr:NAD(+) diphosphatase [Bacteroidaceae bacterium]
MIRYFAFWQGDILLTDEGNIPFGINMPEPLGRAQAVTTITSAAGDECQVIRMDAPACAAAGFMMKDLRQAFQILSGEDYILAGKCRELLYWDEQSRYCGHCGAPLEWHTPISKQCARCGRELWPALAIAIIVRISRGDEILMVRSRSFRGKHYGLVAGFVETGETLEDCVRREVLEETSIHIRNVRYYGSQPWPYPCGLMVGFTAEYERGELRLQSEELTDGGWFTRGTMPEPPAPGSIARQMIDDWLQEEE